MNHAAILHGLRVLPEQDQEPDPDLQTVSWPYGPTIFVSVSPSVSDGDKSEFTGDHGDLLLDVLCR